MNWLDPFFLTVGSTAIAILLAGLLLKRFPPTRINSYYGYRTPSSMRSQQHWDFAQQHSATVAIRLGAATLPFVILSLFLPWDTFTSIIAALVAVAVMVTILILGTERALRHRFNP